MPRFVILEHSWNGTHHDVMLDRGDSLRTWALDEPIVPNATQPARALPDHRRIYLDYEGPISGGRGEVRRTVAGIYREVRWTDTFVVVELASDQLSGWAEFRGEVGGDWFFTFRPGNAD